MIPGAAPVPDRRLSILCFLHSFEPGGVERTALRLCRAWAALGLDVSIAVGREEGALGREAAGLGLLHPPRLPFPRRSLETLWMIAWLPWLILRRRPAILYCPGNSYTIVAVAMKLLLGGRCPPVVAKISNDLGRDDLGPWTRAAYRLWCRVQGRAIDHFIAMSQDMVPEIVERLDVPAGRVAVVHDAVFDRSRLRLFANAGRRARSSQRRPRRFIAAGRLVTQKNFAMLIDAFARGSWAEDELVILGEGPLRRRLQARIDALGLADRIWMPGHVEDIDAWLAYADIFVLSSCYEGVPAVIVEALATGMRIVATDCCASISALIGATESGQIVPSGDVGALAEAIAASCPAVRGNIKAARIAVLHSAGKAALASRAVFLGILADRRATTRSTPPSRLLARVVTAPATPVSSMEKM